VIQAGRRSWRAWSLGVTNDTYETDQLLPPAIPPVVRTLIFESWGIVGWPFWPGTVTSKTPKSFLVIGVASRFQPLKSPMRYARRAFGAHSRYMTSPLGWTMRPNFS
jgi:hypothetical protein